MRLLTLLSKKSFFIILCSGIITACGKEHTGPKTFSRMVQEQRQETQGVYVANIESLNSHIAGNTTGKITVKILNDEFVVEGKISDSPANTRHVQLIHVGTTCPTSTADINADGIIDSTEAMTISGKGLIPLDSDLNSQDDGRDFGPISNNFGNFTYKETASLTRLMTDLRQDDPDIRDELAKISKADELNLVGRVVIIYGVKANTQIPSTAFPSMGLTIEESLPIACGKLIRSQE